MKFRALKAAACALLAFSVMPSVFAAQTDLAGAYIASKHNFRQAVLEQQSLTAVMQDPATYRGRAVEISGDVLGAVVSGSTHTLLMNVSGTEISVLAPEKYAVADWVQPGQKVRMLLSVESVGAVAGGSPFRLISAAPEDAVASAEAVAPAGWMRVSSSSRSVAYVRDPNYGATRSVEAGGGSGTVTAGRPICTLSPAALNVYGRYYLAIRQLNANLTDSEANKITSSVLYFSDQNQVDPRLIIAMIIAESGFDTNATSHTGAMGLGQLMPETARGLGVTDAYDPVQNIGASVRLLRGHLDRYGGAPAHAGVIPFDQIKLVMAAYNAGPGAVSKYHGVPPYRETQNYVRKVAAYYKALCGN
jgi:hypothetical protein